jgi:anthranilate synthase component 1
MQIEPSETAFAERYGRSEPQVVWTTLVADLETPVSAFLKLGAKSMSFLLESVEGGAVRGRYSIIGLDPTDLARITAKPKSIVQHEPIATPSRPALNLRYKRCAR